MLAEHCRSYVLRAVTAIVLFCLAAGCSALSPNAPSASLAAQPTVSTPASGLADIQVTGITSSSALISWTAAKPSIGIVHWGKTADYETTALTEGGPSLQQSMTLTGLKPDTTYHFNVTLKDQSGALTVGPDGIFSTLESLNSSELVISQVMLARITASSATINWVTDKPANGRVEYGPDAKYGSSTQTSTISSVDHSIDLCPLVPTSKYHYRVMSRDKDGNEAASADQAFTTTETWDRTPPMISDIRVSDVTHESAVLNWTTNELATSQVEYDTDLSYGNRTPNDINTTSGHVVLIENLDNNRAYHFRVKSADSAGNLSTSEDATLVTARAPREVLGGAAHQHSECACKAKYGR
jgi:hypothetical protein